MATTGETLEKLIKQCKKNDRVAQGEIYRLFSPKMFAICLRYSGHYSDAQDVLQEGFVHAFNKIKQYKGNGSFEGWLRRIMVNKCMDNFRKHKMTIVSENPHDYTTYEEEPETEEPIFNEKELMKLVQQLPDQYRMVFNLYVIEDYSHAEIAEKLNISVGTSKSNLSRAKSWLRKELKKKLVEGRNIAQHG